MRLPRALAVAACLVMLAVADARLSAQENRAAQEEREEEEREEARRRQPDPLASALDERISGRKSSADFAIDVAWPTRPGLLTSCRIWGDGVGLWNRQVQFRIDRKQVAGLLKAVRRARFGTFPAEVGEQEGGEKEIQGRISVTVGDLTRAVAVIGDEKPDKELEELARAVLAAGEKPAAKGVRIESLGEGLEKLASGALAPQALEVLAQRSIDHPAPDVPADNWMLVVAGRQAHDRVSPRGKAAPSERALALTTKQYEDLVALLRTSDAGSLPRNLYASQYSRLRVQVLNQVVSVEARRFAGMSPDANAEARERFEKIWNACEGLHRLAEASGRTIAAPTPAPKPKKEEKEKEAD